MLGLLLLVLGRRLLGMWGVSKVGGLGDCISLFGNCGYCCYCQPILLKGVEALGKERVEKRKRK